MAKKNKAPTPTPGAQPKKTVAAKKETVVVELRRGMTVGEVELPAGTKVGEVTLEPGFSLNYLVDGLRTAVCGMKKD